MGLKSDTIATFFGQEEFEEILSDALYNAATDKEEDFVRDVQKRYNEYRMNAYLSVKQKDWLLKIANASEF